MHRSPFSRFPRRGGTPLPAHREPKTSSRISGSASAADPKANPGDEKREFYPSIEDVVNIRDLLHRLGLKRQAIPNEIVDMIIDEAEYWPSVVTTLETTPYVVRSDEDRECLRTPPLCFSLEEGSKENESSGKEEQPQTLLHRGIHPCRKIVFDITSHDQGWGGDASHRGTYRGSYTWFDAYIVPSNHKHSANENKEDQNPDTADAEKEDRGELEPWNPRPMIPEPRKLQVNRTATQDSTKHQIVWKYNDDIDPKSSEADRIEEEEGRGRKTLDGQAVRNMNVGDQVVVWIRARFPGWQNNLESMSVRVFWAT
ncbi:hypothetical protein BGW36DRAFT_357716 [Talaromyces proteolyticus]|uniref:Uncharacterized protein n=1 Tax=Talaromyces proteolyticus TaxID=1131652 RepID=A0AAD4KXN0_9EURO|nr:uncharacterized protein BGW36DRAFT_357716 [Talaromyces proteolyticus]KAH8701087.1 hypothetical protein BGW36DRAFT_357716 [Talaromyces proteolyticus]